MPNAVMEKSNCAEQPQRVGDGVSPMQAAERRTLRSGKLKELSSSKGDAMCGVNAHGLD